MLERLDAADVEAVAICLLHSYSEPAHEQRVAAAVADRLPGVHISSSHEVLGLFREYERTSTTGHRRVPVAAPARLPGAACGPRRQAGLPEPEIMQSSGGVVPASAAARHAAWTVLSGPAGGAVGAAYLGALHGSRGRAVVRHGRDVL